MYLGCFDVALGFDIDIVLEVDLDVVIDIVLDVVIKVFVFCVGLSLQLMISLAFKSTR